MTSRSRRKHPITAPNSPRPTIPAKARRAGRLARGASSLLLAAGLWLGQATTPAQEPEKLPWDPQRPTANTQIRLTSGTSTPERGRTKLTWRTPSLQKNVQPVQHLQDGSDSAVRHASGTYGSSVLVPPANRSPQPATGDAFANPFGDQPSSSGATGRYISQEDSSAEPAPIEQEASDVELQVEPALTELVQPAPAAEDAQSSPPMPPAAAAPQPPSDLLEPSTPRELLPPAAQAQMDVNPNCAASEDCKELRTALRSRPLSSISLDITPARNDLGQQGGPQELPYRRWTDRNGRLVAEDARLVDFTNAQVVVRTRQGQTVRFPFAQLSEVDICFVADVWDVPFECRMGEEQFAGRQWSPMTMTWAASALCHKPLYFEEVALERYGHTTGPLLQPALSGAHFFLNIAVLPYKAGISPPTECEYVLGYYRPGDCAPWLVPPVPLSLRGGLVQAGAVLGVSAIIP